MNADRAPQLKAVVMQLLFSLPGPMSVDVIQLYLYCISFSPLIFAYIWFIQWLTSYPRPMSWAVLRIALFRDLLFLISAGIGWALFATDLLYWGIVFVTSSLDVATFYLTRRMAIRLMQRSPGNDAA